MPPQLFDMITIKEQIENDLHTKVDIKYSLKLIQSRCKNIKVSDDFLKDDIGLERLDSISMRLIAVGEGFKNIN